MPPSSKWKGGPFSIEKQYLLSSYMAYITYLNSSFIEEYEKEFCLCLKEIIYFLLDLLRCDCLFPPCVPFTASSI